MATFNPELEKGQPPSFLQYSRGYRDDAAGDAIGGLGTLFTMGVKIKDDAIKQEIKDEARLRVDETNDRSIAELHSITRGEAQGGQAIPPEISMEARRLAAYKEGVARGSARESNYWGAIDATARSLRARYPGYRDHIDDVFKDLTGQIPANAVVRSLRQDYANLTSGNRDPRFDLVKTMSGEGSLPRGAATDPNWTVERLIEHRAQVMGNKFNLQQAKSELEYSEARGKIDEKARFTIARSEFGGIMSQQAQGTVFAERAAAFDRLINDAAQAGTQLTPEQDKAVQDAATARLRALDYQFQQFLTGPNGLGGQPWGKILTTEQINGLRAEVDSIKKDITDTVWNKDYGSASRAAARIRLLSTHSQANVLDDPTARAMNAAKQLFGDDVMKIMINKDNNLTDAQRAVSEGAITRMSSPFVNRGVTSLQEQLTIAQNKGQGGPEVFKSVLDKAHIVITDPKTKPEVRAALVESMYGSRNMTFLNFTHNDKDPAHAHKVFNAMANSDISKSIYKASQEQGNPAMWDKYSKWVISQTYALNALDINTVSRAQLDATSADIRYDSNTMMFTVTPSTEQAVARARARGLDERDARMATAYDAYWNSGIPAKVDRLNASLAPLREIATLSKENKDAFMSTVLYELQLRGQSSDERQGFEPWYATLNRSVDKGVETWARLRQAAGANDPPGIFGNNPDRNWLNPESQQRVRGWADYFRGFLPDMGATDKARNQKTMGQ